MDPWYPLGYGDPVQAAFVLVHLGHMSGDDELRGCSTWSRSTRRAALGLTGYGIAIGDPADFVVFDAPTDTDAIRLGSRRHLVVRAGKVVARTEPAQTTVTWNGEEAPVTFLRP